MSIIQTIRDKYARVAVIAIALCIIGFILMDASVGRSRLFAGSGGGSVGSVNGRGIKYDEFAKKIDNAEKGIEAQQPGISTEAKRGQAVDAVWNQEVNKILLDDELNKLGITVTENERADMIAGNNPSQVAQQYLSPGQGQPYNPAQAMQTVNQIKRSRNAEQKTQLAELLNYMDRVRLEEKFNSLLVNSANVPRWFIESQNADNSRIAKVSFIHVNYIDSLFGPDSAIKVSDEEITAYVNKHKKQFKQTESRGISYINFSAAPTAADTAAVKEKVTKLIAEFRDAADTKLFLDRTGTDLPYYDNYILAKDMQQVNKDSILKIPVGRTYGPYLDNTQFAVAKMVDSKMAPDSVDVRHILVQTADLNRNTGVFTPTRDTAEANKFMNDSVLSLLARGISFDSVCKKYSDDPGSKNTGGVYKNVTFNGGFAKPFVEFAFLNPAGSKKVVYTDFGFHYIEVLKHHGAGNRMVKVGYLSKAIEPSQQTDDEANKSANEFAGKARDLKAFDEVFEKELKPKGFNKGIIASITPNAYSVSPLGDSRSFVRKVYEAKRGEVLQPEKIGMNYVVAVVTDILEEGTQSAATARLMVERDIRNKKKAEMIRKKIGNITTLEAAASVLKKTVETVDSVSGANPRNFPIEQKLLGAVFYAANKGKVVPEVIEGSQGIYLLQVLSTGTAPVANANVTERRTQMISTIKNMAQYRPVIATLKEAAKIKDNRIKKNF